MKILHLYLQQVKGRLLQKLEVLINALINELKLASYAIKTVSSSSEGEV